MITRTELLDKIRAEAPAVAPAALADALETHRVSVRREALQSLGRLPKPTAARFKRAAPHRDLPPLPFLCLSQRYLRPIPDDPRTPDEPANSPPEKTAREVAELVAEDHVRYAHEVEDLVAEIVANSPTMNPPVARRKLR